ncbi:MAG TPA: hypothetical protein VHG27_02895 [Xanthobacteraceae bacterium]|nr:hypothetical protein [Xanthobacteraceae bacterium]
MSSSTSSAPVPGVHPPRPRLTLRVGVSGHRWGSSLDASAIPRIRTQIRGTLACAEAVACKLHREHSEIFSVDAPQLAALSCMAEGGDRLFAHEALAAGWQLQAVLPFAANDYEKDFVSEEATTEFRKILSAAASVFEIGDPRSEQDASEAYETAGLVMLDHADLVVAIWDGGESRGRGGTREIVDEAIRRGAPVVWINTTRECPAAIWDGHSAVPLPEPDASSPNPPALLESTIAAVLSPPGNGDAADVEAAQRLRRFLGETEAPSPWWSASYDLMLRLTAQRPLRFPAQPASIASRRREWDGFLHDLPRNGQLSNELRTILLARFLWADHVADRLGRAYRGAYVLNFSLAALAVLVGLLAVFFWDSILMKTVFALLEFGLIAVILAITRAGARGAWHARFLDARRLAELLRHARVLAPLGRTAATGAGEPASSDAGERWTGWYAQATERELNLPHARADADYLQAVLQATAGHEVAPQLDYHRNNQRRLNRVHHALDHAGERLFYLTGALCLLWVALAALYEAAVFGQVWIKSGAKPLFTFLAAVLPAIGAALAGIRAQGDFEASAKRSQATARELEELSGRLAQGPGGYREACLLQLRVVDAMAGELGSWRSLYANRPLTIPG